MAERRMFSKTVIDSDNFLELPASAQLLYFHLAMRADDDGFVNRPRSITRMCGMSAEDMKALVAGGYLIAFDSGVVAIRHWRVNNYIQKDHYKSTIHTKEKAMLRADENNVYDLDTACIQSVPDPDTQDRSGQDRSGKDRSVKDRTEDCGEPPTASDALLTDEQRAELESESSVLSVENYEKKIIDWQTKKGRRCKDPFGTIKKWISEDKARSRPAHESSYDLEEYEKFALNYDFSSLMRGRKE